MKETLELLLDGVDLAEARASDAMGWLADEAVPSAWKGAFLAMDPQNHQLVERKEEAKVHAEVQGMW